LWAVPDVAEGLVLVGAVLIVWSVFLGMAGDRVPFRTFSGSFATPVTAVGSVLGVVGSVLGLGWWSVPFLAVLMWVWGRAGRNERDLPALVSVRQGFRLVGPRAAAGRLVAVERVRDVGPGLDESRVGPEQPGGEGVRRTGDGAGGDA